MFYIRSVPDDKIRGNHAHRKCKQFFIPIHGTCEIEIIHKRGEQVASLDNPRRGLFVPEMCWVRVTEFDKDTVLLVLASEPYDTKDYINDFEDFKANW
jgi:dTDP-4-dehydrorhamnose 3,5-epimerase-like enzyme